MAQTPRPENIVLVHGARRRRLKLGRSPFLCFPIQAFHVRPFLNPLTCVSLTMSLQQNVAIAGRRRPVILVGTLLRR